jgi:uncharacterized protein (TIGR02996 family)
VEKQERGFEPANEVVGEHACEPALVAAILDAPDQGGEDAYLVYADWLQSRGDPRGELIVLQHGLARKPHDARLLRAARQFQREHGARMLPPRLGRFAVVPPGDGQERDDPCQIEWKLGFAHKARIDRSQAHSPCTVRELVLALLDHPSGMLLHELTIGGLGPGQPQGGRLYDYRPVVAALCEAAPASLRALFLADLEQEASEGSDLGDVSLLFSSLPRLAHLHLCAGAMVLGDIRAPALRWFGLRTAALGASMLGSVNRADWPRLEELAIDCQDQPLAIDALPALLAGESAPALRRLALTRTTRTRDVWAALARSPLLGRLEELDLCRGDLADGDVADMIAGKEAFRHLRRLVLDGNYISRGHRADVYALGAGVSLKDQRGAAADLPPITEDQIIELAPDARSYLAAGDVADPRRWPRLGSWIATVWGRYQGTSLYDVFVDLRTMEAGCTCPSSKDPCKHVLGLLRLCVRGRLIPVQEPPEGFIDGCRASRYQSI